MKETKTTPMMEQWAECKKQAEGMLLLFRMGDFYEAFYEDATHLAHELELTLTKRQEIPMAGIPWHSADTYIDRLVGKGYKVAIAEQTEDPKQAKGLVKREIVRVVTPGTLTSSTYLSEKHNNFLAAIVPLNTLWGLSVLDLSTGDFKVTECEQLSELFNELARLNPAEYLITEKTFQAAPSFFEGKPFTKLFDWECTHEKASRFLTEHFQVHTLDGFGLAGMVVGINAAGALLSYVRDTLSHNITHVQKLLPYTSHNSLRIDATTTRHLELFRTLQEGKKQKSLLNFLDETQTPMGARLLHNWLARPLLCPSSIQKRQESVEELYYSGSKRAELNSYLKSIRDLERLTMKLSTGSASPKDIKALHLSLIPLFDLKSFPFSSSYLKELQDQIHTFDETVQLLQVALSEEPPLRTNEGGIFKEGYNSELDELKQLAQNGKQWLQNYQEKLKEELQIKTLKVSYNRVFGYYIEVSKGQAAGVPSHFHRKQTLANAERFISDELKTYEEKILTSHERMIGLEQRLFEELKQKLLSYKTALFETARSVAAIDVLCSFAHIAQTHHYCRPEVNESELIQIKGGRHPVVEGSLGRQHFISNETHLDHSDCQLALITGPNMAGKSTYIRQVALIVILAQMGSFIPAQAASIGIVDQIFSRIGASDDLAKGQSTFMVEMTETANILNNATERSLVILDEIGRGTSTYDGVSIAWSVAEYLLTQPKKRAKTLFATHYWELTQLTQTYPHAKNFHAQVEEWNDEIIFLHKIASGGADKSYGIHVARLAGLPQEVIVRAKQILAKLETKKDPGAKKVSTSQQLSLF